MYICAQDPEKVFYFVHVDRYIDFEMNQTEPLQEWAGALDTPGRYVAQKAPFKTTFLS